MRNLIKSAALAALMASTAAPALAGEWYVGGTLAKANLGQWYGASGANRLASSADAVTVLNIRQGKRIHPRDTRTQSAQLVICIGEVASDSSLWSMKVSEVTAACMVAMGWL